MYKQMDGRRDEQKIHGREISSLLIDGKQMKIVEMND